MLVASVIMTVSAAADPYKLGRLLSHESNGTNATTSSYYSSASYNYRSYRNPNTYNITYSYKPSRYYSYTYKPTTYYYSYYGAQNKTVSVYKPKGGSWGWWSKSAAGLQAASATAALLATTVMA